MVAKQAKQNAGETDDIRRTAVLAAAAKIFFSKGYERTTTLDIATAAKVSKRVLYELFGTKHGILEALIKSGAKRMQKPVDLPSPQNAESFYATLKEFGRVFLEELFSARNIAMHRLAIAEAGQSKTVARELEASGSGPVVAMVEQLFRQAIAGNYVRFAFPDEVVSVFFYTLIGDIRMKLLMGANIKVDKNMIEQRATFAIRVVRQLELG